MATCKVSETVYYVYPNYGKFIFSPPVMVGYKSSAIPEREQDYSQNSYSTEKRELQGKSEATYSKANLPNNTQLESKRWHYKLIKSKLKGKVMRL